MNNTGDAKGNDMDRIVIMINADGSVGGQSSFGLGKAKVFAGGGGSGPAGGENSDIAGGGGGGTGGSAAVSSGASGLPGLQTSLLDRKAGQGARSAIANTTWYAESESRTATRASRPVALIPYL